MELLERAEEFVARKMSNMSTSDRVSASREARALVLDVNELYKESKDPTLMDLMKRLTKKKKRIESRLKGAPLT